MKIAILKNATGAVTVVHFANETDAKALSKYRDAIFPGMEIVGECDPSTLPSWRFLDCWRHNGKTVIVDMALAREQRLTEIRSERMSRFVALDAEWMRATGQKRAAEADAIEARRQLLRDIPQMLIGQKALDGVVCKALLSDCRTVEELETLVPTWPEP